MKVWISQARVAEIRLRTIYLLRSTKRGKAYTTALVNPSVGQCISNAASILLAYTSLVCTRTK